MVAVVVQHDIMSMIRVEETPGSFPFRVDFDKGQKSGWRLFESFGDLLNALTHVDAYHAFT
jgi:hypothetical protein